MRLKWWFLWFKNFFVIVFETYLVKYVELRLNPNYSFGKVSPHLLALSVNCSCVLSTLYWLGSRATRHRDSNFYMPYFNRLFNALKISYFSSFFLGKFFRFVFQSFVPKLLMSSFFDKCPGVKNSWFAQVVWNIKITSNLA